MQLIPTNDLSFLRILYLVHRQTKLIAGMVMMVTILGAGASTISVDGSTAITITDGFTKLFQSMDRMDRKLDRIESNVNQNINALRMEQQRELQQIRSALNEVRSDVNTLQKDHVEMKKSINEIRDEIRKLNNALAKVI